MNAQKTTPFERIAHPDRNPDVWQAGLAKLRNLVLNVTQKRDLPSAFVEFQRLLEALPLSTEEFGLAGNRLRNSRRYLDSDEWGAAKYELLLLERSLVLRTH